MTEQIIDLRSTWAILRRRAGVLVLAGAVGAAAGGAAVYLHPPAFSSTSQVLLPAPPQGATSAGAHTIDTQVQIASSEAVLGPAGRAVSPQLSTSEVGERVDIEAKTSDVLQITATGATARQAQALSEAIAAAEVAYLKDAASTLGQEALKALDDRRATLKENFDAVNLEIEKTKARIAAGNPKSSQVRVDVTVLSQLTAQQAALGKRIDDIDQDVLKASDVGSGQATGFSVIQHASPAERMSVPLTIALFTTLGAAAALLLVGFVLVLRGRREATLRSRDQVADAIGIPVVASIESGTPRSVAGWTDLLRDYTPDNVEMWTLRQLVRLVTPGHPGSLAADPREADVAPAVVVITLSDDLRALAVGPQLASFAASTGLATTLVTAQSHESANALWAACSGLAPEAHPRPGLSVDSRHGLHPVEDLVVHVAVVDRQRPELRVRAADHAVTLLAVSAGAATADDLARVALAADDARHPIARIVIVDPDPLDRTTGRLLPSERAHHATLPSLMTGSPVAGEATALDKRRRLQ
jgi:capsular polysaccharide biosynthesis protein